MSQAMDVLGVSLTNTDGTAKPLNEILLKLRSSMKDLTEEEKAQYSAMLAGKQSMAGLLAIVNASDEEFANLTKSINESNGAAERMAEIKLDNVSGDWTLLKSSIEGAGIAFGESLEPRIRDFLKSAKEVVDSFAEMSDGSKNLLVDMTAFGLGMGITLKAFGSVVTGIGNMNNLFKQAADLFGTTTKAVGLTTLGFGALALAIFGLYEYSKYLDGANQRMLDSMNEAREGIDKQKEAVQNAKDAYFDLAEAEKAVAEAETDTEKEEALKRLKEVQDAIIDQYPDLIKGASDEASAREGLLGALDNQIEKEEKLLAMKKNQLGAKATEYLNENKGYDLSDGIKNYEQTVKYAQEYNDLKNELLQLDENTIINGKKVKDILKDINNDEIINSKQMNALYEDMTGYADALLAKQESGKKLSEQEAKWLKEWQSYMDKGFEGELVDSTKYEGVSEAVAASLGVVRDELNLTEEEVKQYEEAVTGATEKMKQDFGSMNGEVASAFENLKNNLYSGEITLDEFNSAVDMMAYLSSEAFGKLPESAQNSINSMVTSLSNGKINGADFSSAMQTYLSVASTGFQGLNKDSQDACDRLVSDFNANKISAEEFQTAMVLMQGFSDGVYNGLSKSSQDTMQQLKGDFLGNKITAQQFAQGVGQALGLTEGDLASLASASASDLGQLISDLLSGKVNANNLQGAISALKSKEITVTTNFVQKGTAAINYEYKNGVAVPKQGRSMPAPPQIEQDTPTIETYSEPQSRAIASPMSYEATPLAEPLSDTSNEVTTSSSPGVSTFANNSFTNAFDGDPYEGLGEDAKKAAQSRVQAEKDADSQILKLRNELYKALKNKIQEQKDQEMSIYDARIEAIRKEMELLDKSVTESPADKLKEEQEQLTEYQSVLAKLEEEKAKWAKNNSALSKQKQAEIQSQIEEQQKKIEEQQKNVNKAQVELEKERLQEQIDIIEQEKQASEEKFDKQLEDQNLYNEANKMMQENNMQQMVDLITTWAPDYSEAGMILGKSLVEAMSEEIKKGVEAMDYLKNPNNKPNTSTGGNSSSGGSSTPKPEPPKEDKPKRGKVTASGLNVRSGAGTSNKILDSVYRGDEVEILESKDGWYYIDYYSKWRKKRDKGWASGNYIQTFATGGYTGDWAGSDGKLALLHQKEQVLNSDQTKSFHALVFDWIPKLEAMFKNLPTSTTNMATTNGLTYNSVYNIQNNTDFDERNMEDNIIYNLKKQMKNMGKKF